MHAEPLSSESAANLVLRGVRHLQGPMIIGADQILVDLVVEVDDDLGIYERFGLERNTQCLAEARHAPLMAEMLKRMSSPEQDGRAPVRATPGGMIGNSMRAAAWWLKRQRASGASGLPEPAVKMLGMVGNDEAAGILRRELAAADVEPLLTTLPQEDGSPAEPSGPSTRTGVCCCLIAGKERTMITELGAGRSMEFHGRKSPLFPSWDERLAAITAKAAEEKTVPRSNLPTLVVLSGFYAQADPDGAEAIVRWCSAPRCTLGGGSARPLLAVSLSAMWCVGLPPVQAAGKASDFVFGNEGEIFALAAVLPEGSALPADDFGAAMSHIAKWKESGLIVATRGSKSVCAIRAGPVPSKLYSVPVPPVPLEEFVDDVGAGDAFLGAFLACAWQTLAKALASAPEGEGNGKKRKHEEDSAADLLTAEDIEAAAKAGIHTAAAVLRCVGAQFPANA